MDHFAGLDVSVKETSICIVDDAGKIVREVKVASEPEALLAVLKNLAYHFKRIGLGAGPLLLGAVGTAEKCHLRHFALRRNSRAFRRWTTRKSVTDLPINTASLVAQR